LCHQAAIGAADNFKRRLQMTKSNETKSTASNSPAHIAYHVRNGKSEKGFWTRIGSAWQHSDGHGFNIQLDATPIDGRITLRVASEISK
jgi:hypothetical protein